MSTTNYGPTLAQRLTPSVARYQQVISEILQTLRVSLPGIVSTFNAGPPATVDVQIATEELVVLNVGGAGTVSLDAQSKPLPLLTHVPVMVPSAGGYSLTFPIKAGDECMVVFQDTPVAMWFQNGASLNALVKPYSQRRHHLSDAIAIFGLRSTPHAISAWSTTSAQLRNDAASVVVDLAASVLTVTAPTVTVNAQTANVNGTSNVNVTGGNVTIGSSTTIDSRVFLNHLHSGVQTGTGVTGGVL
jgi:hypothetical protein